MNAPPMNSEKPTFYDGTLLEKAFSSFKNEKIISICSTIIPNFRPVDSRTKLTLFKCIASAERHIQDQIKTTLAAARGEKDGRRFVKRKDLHDAIVVASGPNKKRRLDDAENRAISETSSPPEDEGVDWEEHLEEMLASDYMKTPSKDQRYQLIEDFMERTGNEAMSTVTCASCARETMKSNASLIAFRDIHNRSTLKPRVPHPSHDLYHGMLLEPHGVEDGQSAWICRQCGASIAKEQKPQYALANDMWIGRTPLQLKLLTLPERILVSRYFVVAYIVKLFPKQANAYHWDQSQMHSGLRGNVSTYKLNPSLVAPFLKEFSLPPPPTILSATIGVTFVTPKGIPEKSLLPLFKVRKQRVKDALLWLKSHNPLYADITLSETNLEALPTDGVPEEIMAVVRHSDDVETVMKEHGGYVPLDAADERAEEAGLIIADDDEARDNNDAVPSVIPLMANGVVDSEGVAIPDNELMSHALQNFARNPELNIKVQRGGVPVNEYARIDPTTREPFRGTSENPNHLLGCFPVLFPYGEGGLEVHRETKVSYEGHVRWCLEYFDKRFRLDQHFIFQVFGVIQKRQVCRSAVLQIQKSAFVTHKEAIASLTAQDLEKASEEESRNLPYSNPIVRDLRKQLKAIRTRVDGTDESRHSLRSDIWGTTLIFNAPSLWVTVNPADTQDPIAQVIAGAAINLDDFSKLEGPDHMERSRNIANDPYASAKYFHFVINTLLEVVFGLEKSRGGGGIKRKSGAFGIVQAYVGAMEAQQRGTLHVHMLLWLKDTPNTDDIRRALHDERFRNKIQEYIRNTVKADIDQLPTEQVRDIPKEAGVSYSRPFDARQNPTEIKATEKKLARAVQFHTCQVTNCLKPSKDGKLVCKRGAPFSLAISEWVNSKGEWGPKRHCGYFNNWNEVILFCLRCNHDIKLIVNGGETCVLVLYTGNYATKKQGRATNTAALLASRLAYHRASNTVSNDILDNNRLLFQRCANSLFTQNEFSGPEIVSYLMGWGDSFKSHNYTPIYLDSALNTLRSYYPGLKRNLTFNSGESTLDDTHGPITVIDGDIQLKNQLADYEFRGEELENFNLYDFLIDTYEIRLTEKDDQEESTPNRGRPRNPRVRYLEHAGKPKMARMIRADDHEILPRIVGQWFPANNDQSCTEIYSACMLLLFQPWRSLKDLKDDSESFSSRFQFFFKFCPKRHIQIIANIQYYHDCWEIASRRREALKEGKSFALFDYEPEVLDAALNETDENTQEALDSDIPLVVTEGMIEAHRTAQNAPKDIRFAKEAMEKAYASSIFTPNSSSHPFSGRLRSRALASDLSTFDEWDAQLKSATREMYEQSGMIDISASDHFNPTISLAGPSITGTQNTTDMPILLEPQPTIHPRPKVNILRADQKLAHDYIERRLTNELKTSKREPLRFLILGQGGTGKSMLTQAITETYKYHDQEHALAKCGSTGISACDIEGMTVHAWAGLSAGTPRSDKWLHTPTHKMDEKRKKNIGHKKTVIIDEVSMITHSIFANLSRVCSVTKSKLGECQPEDDFGGMHMVIMGDFHQFPPVANEKGALYCIPPSSNVNASLGRELFLRFTDVIILREQMRIQDETWSEILSRLRVGGCTPEDIDEIQKLILTSPKCDVPDFNATPWEDAVLITTRHTVREAWNSAVLRKFAKSRNEIIYVCPAEDTLKDGSTPSLETQYQIAGMQSRKTGKLVDRLELAVGMKAMVLLNMATEAEIANGTRGTIEDIILDPREAPTLIPDNEGVVVLKYPPVLVLFKPDRGCKLSFRGNKSKGISDIVEGLVPLKPSSVTFSVSTSDKSSISITRRQFSLTAAYAFTDFKSQGQTIFWVIIDIRSPPTGRMSPFNVYVSLSRSRGRKTIRLLDDFDVSLFTNHPSAALATEMTRLEALDAITRTKIAQELATD